MPNTCNKCGEYTKVRKITIDINDNGVGYPHFPIYEYSYICKKCDDAENILSKKRIEKYKKEKILKRQNWIKQRDEILMENEK